MKKSLLAVVIAIVTLLTLVTNVAYAANEDVTLEKVKDTICKIEMDNYGNVTKKLISVENSTKTVKLQVDVENNKSEEETIKPSEIFLVLDNSDSMTKNSLSVDGQSITRKQAVFNAAKALASSIIAEQPSTKIGVVRFSTSTDTSKYGTLEDASLVTAPTTSIDQIKSGIDGIEANGACTDIDAGLQTALSNFSTDTNTNKYLILLTDGVPNVAVGGPTQQYSGEVATKTKKRLQAVIDKGINLVTVMTGVNSSYMPDADGTLCPDAAGKTYLDLATEIFGTQSNSNYGKFYYVSDANVTKTITNNVYADVVKKVTNEIKNIVLEDYFPDNIIENYEVAITDVTTTSDKVVMSQPVVDNANKKIVWNIQSLPAGAKATCIYTLTLKEKFNEEIIDLETPTNKKVDVKYDDPSGKTNTKTSDDSPSIILRKEKKPADNTTAPDPMPNTGDNSGLMTFIVIALGVLVCIGISKYYKAK